MKAKEIMSLEVVCVSPDSSILEAVRSTLQNRISGLPVVDRQGMLVGVVTEGDFLRQASGRNRDAAQQGSVDRILHGSKTVCGRGSTPMVARSRM